MWGGMKVEEKLEVGVGTGVGVETVGGRGRGRGWTGATMFGDGGTQCNRVVEGCNVGDEVG